MAAGSVAASYLRSYPCVWCREEEYGPTLIHIAPTLVLPNPCQVSYLHHFHREEPSHSPQTRKGRKARLEKRVERWCFPLFSSGRTEWLGWWAATPFSPFYRENYAFIRAWRSLREFYGGKLVHDECLVKFQESCSCLRPSYVEAFVSHVHCRGRCWLLFLSALWSFFELWWGKLFLRTVWTIWTYVRKLQ